MNEATGPNTEALPTPGIEILRAIVERYGAMQRVVDEYHELNNAVHRLRGYVPGEQPMSAMGIIEYLHRMFREIAEAELRGELTEITANPKLHHLRSDEIEE